MTTLYEGTSQIQKLIIGRAETGINALVPCRDVVGVLGAGTMGPASRSSPRAAARARSSHDPDAEALERGLRAARASGCEDETARLRLEPAAELADLAGADIVIEAAPESLELKRELFGRWPRSCARTACSPPTRRRCR